MLKDFLNISEGFSAVINIIIVIINNSIIVISIITTARLLLFISISPATHSLNITIIPLLPEALRASVSDLKTKDGNYINFETKAPLRGLWYG